MRKVSKNNFIVAGSAYIFQAMLVGLSILGRYRFVGERYSGKLVVVVTIPDVLDIFENRIQVLHSLTVEETYLSDEILRRSTSIHKDSKRKKKLTATLRAVKAPREKPTRIISSPGS